MLQEVNTSLDHFVLFDHFLSVLLLGLQIRTTLHLLPFVLLLQDLQALLTDIAFAKLDRVLKLGPVAVQLLAIQIYQGLFLNDLLLEVAFLPILLLLGFFPPLPLLQLLHCHLFGQLVNVLQNAFVAVFQLGDFGVVDAFGQVKFLELAV